MYNMSLYLFRTKRSPIFYWRQYITKRICGHHDVECLIFLIIMVTSDLEKGLKSVSNTRFLIETFNVRSFNALVTNLEIR